MSYQNLNTIPTVNTQEVFVGRNVALRTRPASDPAIARLVIDWADYGVGDTVPNMGVRFAASAQGQNTANLDKIRSAKIDNSYSPVPVYLTFDDTGDVLQCPAFGIVQAPVLTNGLTGVLYGTGFYTGRVPSTALELFNGDLEPLYIPGQLSNPVTLKYSGFDFKSNLNSNSFVFTPLVVVPDPPMSGRILIASGYFYFSSNAAPPTFAVSINGLVCTVDIVSQVVVTVANRRLFSFIAHAIVPTGAAGATVTVTWGAAITASAVCFVTSMTGYTQALPFTTNSYNQAGAGTLVMGTTLRGIPGAAAVFVAADNVPNGAPNWQGPDLIQVIEPDAASAGSLAYGEFFSPSTLSANVPGNVLAGASWI